MTWRLASISSITSFYSQANSYWKPTLAIAIRVSIIYNAEYLAYQMKILNKLPRLIFTCEIDATIKQILHMRPSEIKKSVQMLCSVAKKEKKKNNKIKLF